MSDSFHFLVEWAKHAYVFALGIGEDEADDLRPQLLLVLDQLVDGGEDLILIFDACSDGSLRGKGIWQLIVVREEVAKVALS